MKKSKRHHYVPQFMTKYFSDENGKIYVYDKIKDNFFEGNSMNLFLEKDRNTFKNLDNIDDDVIEKVYTSFDSLFSRVFREITTSTKVSSDNFKLLLFFAYFSKWRVKQYDESFKNAKEHFSVDDLGLGFKNGKNERLDINLEEFFNLEMQQELKRILLAIQPFRFKDDFKRLLKNSFLVCTATSSFISDCPFNEATIISDELFEDFVFPITKDLTLVYSTRIDVLELQDFLLNGDDNKVSKFLNDFSFARDVSSLDLSERNVGCCNEEYLKHVVNTYNSFKEKKADIIYHLTVFNIIYNYKEYMIDK